MKVLVLNNAAPFIQGGAEALADNLVAELNGTPGVSAELMRLPFRWWPSERLIDEILLHRRFRLYNVDRVVALKFPAYLVPHPQKTLWLLHQFRQAYDLAEAGAGLGNDPVDLEVRDAIRHADNACFAESRRIFVNSPVTEDRLRRYNGFASEVLYPPLNNAELFRDESLGDYVFAGGRISLGKRQHLLVEAMARLPAASFRLLIAGPPDSPEDGERLKALVAEHGVQERVEVALGFHPRDQIAAWVNGARACACLPFDEDSLSYVAMEAFAAGKSVLTTHDAGGLLEIVRDEDTGIVVAPEPAALAEGLARLAADPRDAARRGRAAASVWRGLGLTWSKTIERLLS